MAATEVVPEDVVRAIRGIYREFMDSVAAKDAERLAVLYADDARILMPGRTAITGKSEILAFWKASLDGPVEQIVLDSTHIEVSGDLAYDFGTSRIVLKPPGEAPHEEKGKYVTVYRRQQAGDWKMVVDSYSSNG
ncbi:MAG: SgcJ/EcaC family oxidoreductase [Acidobacteriia bacterium]|nr:SgcJ/EcaC family oxidoreductase [Terriglobia bacterium]